MNPERSHHLSRVRRLVVKVGSSLVTGGKTRGIRTRFLSGLASQIRGLKGQGVECLVVTSGAIAAGLSELGLRSRPTEIPMLQALAAVGQSNLMHAYELTFHRHGLKVAQILLTREDISNPQRYANARNTLGQLFKHEIVPVVNENDTVAVEEIKFGDNDNLASLVSQLVKADLLVLLTDTDGFFEEDPRVNPRAKLLSDITTLDSRLEKSAAHSRSPLGTGGMATKIQAAKKMMQSGVPMVIANGNKKNILGKILSFEKVGTFFHPSGAARGNS